MKLATFTIAGERRVGVVDAAAETVATFDLPLEESRRGVLAIVERQARGEALPQTVPPVPLSRVHVEAPIPRPVRNIFCVGKNYYDHAREFSASGFDSSAAQGAVPAHPIVFSKVPECVIGPEAAIEFTPSVSAAIDYEVELGVIIGRGGRAIRGERALDHVWGYTIINDVTARDLQGRFSQWLIGKSQDTFCPMGPWAVSREEIELADTALRCWVNDELRQESNTALMIFDVAKIIETIAAGVTLVPGDIIATGTPAGVGIGFDPPRYLVDGDVVRLEIDGLGVLRNSVREIAP